jgi:hypothetical protein
MEEREVAMMFLPAKSVGDLSQFQRRQKVRFSLPFFLFFKILLVFSVIGEIRHKNIYYVRHIVLLHGNKKVKERFSSNCSQNKKGFE